PSRGGEKGAERGAERRAGGRSALIATLRTPRGLSFNLACTHLEVLTTRKCRAHQMRFLLEQIGEGPAVIAGDLNTNTFDRGSRAKTVRSLIALLRSDVEIRTMR